MGIKQSHEDELSANTTLKKWRDVIADTGNIFAVILRLPDDQAIQAQFSADPGWVTVFADNDGLILQPADIG